MGKGKLKRFIRNRSFRSPRCYFRTLRVVISFRVSDCDSISHERILLYCLFGSFLSPTKIFIEMGQKSFAEKREDSGDNIAIDRFL